ncbi:MAG: PAS domain-containing protein, partial [Planctomycetes bacterium]|nr:PAS domain-containing protein [Planctomycetota bacterium]
TDYLFIDVNPAYEDLTGLNRDEIVGKLASEVMPGSENSPLIKIYDKVAIGGESARFDRYIEELGEHYRIVAFSSRPGEFTTIITDVTDLRQEQ